MFRHNLVSLDAIFREPRLTIISSQHISWLRALINCIKMLRFMLVCFSLLNFLVAQSNMMHKACPYETAAQYHLDWTGLSMSHFIVFLVWSCTLYTCCMFLFYFSLIILCGHLLFLNIVGIYFFMLHIIQSNAVWSCWMC